MPKGAWVASGSMQRSRVLTTCLIVLCGAQSLRESAMSAGIYDLPSGERHPLTVTEAIETTRVQSNVTGFGFTSDGSLHLTTQDILESPDGRTYAAVLVRGDVSRNGNWVEVLSGGLQSLGAARDYKIVAQLFTTSLGHEDCGAISHLTIAYHNPVRWLDDERIAFLFSSGSEKIQAIAVNVRTGIIEKLTNHDTDVVSFSLGSGGVVVYSARVARATGKSEYLIKHGFAVKNADVYSVLRGRVDGYSTLDECWDTERFIKAPGGAAPTHVVVNSQGYDRWTSSVETQFSPDGRSAIIDGSPSTVPPQWLSYTDPLLKEKVRDAVDDIDGFAARTLRQLFVVNLKDGRARALWSAPALSSTKVAWSPDGREIVLGPTYLPIDGADASGLRGEAVVEIDLNTGRWNPLPVEASLLKGGISAIRWRSLRKISVIAGIRETQFRQAGNRWVRVAARTSRSPGAQQAAVRVEVRQGMNEPPALVAVEAGSGAETRILDLNPALKSVQLGYAQSIEWIDHDNRRWRGRIYFPVHYGQARRYPLVIQTHGIPAESEFSLYGPGFPDPGVGPGISVYAAQVLAGRGIFVLQVDDKSLPDVLETPREPEMYMHAYEVAITQLVDRGLVDPEKVGIVGFSRTGWHVEYALTHSAFPYAAAVVSDNRDNSYLQSTFAWIAEDGADIGAAPFGSGLTTWLERAPGFGVERIHTPLRLQVETGGLERVLTEWEMFSRLRQLKKPVELVVIPEIQRGSHSLQNPAQCLAAEEGAVDWFDFWLNGHEDGAPEKAEQYSRWRSLRLETRRTPQVATAPLP